MYLGVYEGIWRYMKAYKGVWRYMVYIGQIPSPSLFPLSPPHPLSHSLSPSSVHTFSKRILKRLHEVSTSVWIVLGLNALFVFALTGVVCVSKHVSKISFLPGLRNCICSLLNDCMWFTLARSYMVYYRLLHQPGCLGCSILVWRISS